jgi:UDP-N-acetyl-D-mannosaminuronate dehydrogenase
MKITVAGVGYVGLSLAVLLAQKHDVTAITTTESKAEMLNQFISPIQDDEIERFFKEAREGKRKLNLFTTTDKEAAYSSADLVIIATPTNYDDVNHFFDTSAVEDAIEYVRNEVEVGDVLEISYNRIYAPGDVLGFTEEDEETGEGFRVSLQLNGEILNQAVEIDFKEIADDLIEMRHINDEKELVIEIL